MSTTDLTSRLQRQAEKVLDLLERVQQRTVQVYSRSREHERKSVRLFVQIFVPAEDGSEPTEGSSGMPAWSYDVSQSGIGFISCDPMPESFIYVGLTMGNKLTWRKGKIVRRREVPESTFIDYGVTFRIS